MDWGLAFAAVPTDLLATLADVAPLGVTVFAALAGIGIAIRVFGKFGVKK